MSEINHLIPSLPTLIILSSNKAAKFHLKLCSLTLSIFVSTYFPSCKKNVYYKPRRRSSCLLLFSRFSFCLIFKLFKVVISFFEPFNLFYLALSFVFKHVRTLIWSFFLHVTYRFYWVLFTLTLTVHKCGAYWTLLVTTSKRGFYDKTFVDGNLTCNFMLYVIYQHLHLHHKFAMAGYFSNRVSCFHVVFMKKLSCFLILFLFVISSWLNIKNQMKSKPSAKCFCRLRTDIHC